MIQICLHLSLEAHRHKELIVLQHSISSLKGLASYSPFAGKFFRKMLFINWHRNCNVKLQASCLLWHRSYGSYLFQVSVNTLDSNGGSAGGRILYGPHKGWKSISPQPLIPAQMMNQCNLKGQAVAQYPRMTLQWCPLNLRRRRCLMGQW